MAYLSEELQTLNAVVQEHVTVFRKELGQMPKFKTKLAVKPGAKPSYVCPRHVPFALCGQRVI